jgi:transcriptional regulator with XRE-family HTH domain
MKSPLFEQKLIKKLASRRKSLNVSQFALDDAIGVTSGLVAKWECGNRRPTLWNAWCWAQALGCEIRLEILSSTETGSDPGDAGQDTARSEGPLPDG